ncbi:hypothetical protein PRLR6025_21870 [Prevotella lacticifex]|nr:hypothetical protein PRLR6025_21870 [Prevotella lacticifex]
MLHLPALCPPFPSLSPRLLPILVSCFARPSFPLSLVCAVVFGGLQPAAPLSLPSRSPLSALYFPLPLPSFPLSLVSAVVFGGLQPAARLSLPSRSPLSALSFPLPLPSFPLSLVSAVVFGGLQPAARLSLPSSPERFVLFPEQFPFLSFFLIFPCDNFHPYLSPSF